MTARFQPVVTVSATYGAAGTYIAPRLAEEMGLPFVDRVISPDMSQHAVRAAASAEGLQQEEKELAPAGRFLSYFARAASVGAMMAPDPIIDDDETIRAAVEEPLKALAQGAPAVVLGRAGAIVLRNRPRTYHVRLDGAVERRIAWGAKFEHLDLEAARQRQAETDKVRIQFVKRVYRVDPTDWTLYHMTVDPTVLGMDPALKVVVAAARAFFEANPE